MDWRREAAGEAHVERGSGAACGDPRRPTGFVDCRPRCRALGEGSPQTKLCEGAAVDGPEARPRGAKRPLRLCASEADLTSVVSGPFPPSLRDKQGQAPSISPKWPQLVFLFIFLISLFMISTAQSGSFVARECCRDSTFLRSSILSLFFLTYPVPFPCAPPTPFGQQSSLFLPTLRLRVATRSPYYCACAFLLSWGLGRKGAKGLAG